MNIDEEDDDDDDEDTADTTGILEGMGGGRIGGGVEGRSIRGFL